MLPRAVQNKALQINKLRKKSDARLARTPRNRRKRIANEYRQRPRANARHRDAGMHLVARTDANDEIDTKLIVVPDLRSNEWLFEFV